MRIKKKKIIKAVITIILILLTILIISIYNTTGFLQASSIDSRDLQKWEYEGDTIKNTKEFSIIGRTNTCWFLIHSYTATPIEMKELARTISSDLKDFVFITKLSGHGEVPSKLEGKNLEIWYEEEEKKFNTLFKSLCTKINVVGSSLGSIIALRLAEEREEVNNIYILNPFLRKPYEFYKVLPYETRTKLFSSILNYQKKKQPGEINSPQLQKLHISYLNMPYEPIKDSLPFIEETISNLEKIENPTFIFFSKNDQAADPQTAKTIHDGISSKNKLLLQYADSNHLLLMDNDKNKVILDIITVENRNR